MQSRHVQSILILAETLLITLGIYMVAQSFNAAPVLRYLYFIPIAHAALKFGTTGSVSVAVLADVLFIPLIALSIRTEGPFGGPTVELLATLFLLPFLAYFAGSGWGRLSRQHELYRFLSGMGDLFGKSLPQHDVLTHLLKQGALLMDAAGAEIVLVDGETNTAHVAAAWGISSLLEGPYEQSLAEYIIDSNTTWSSLSLEYDLHFARVQAGPHIESVLAVPLHSGAAAVGILAFYNRSGGFNRYEHAAIKAIGSKVEVVLESYRHLEQVAERERLQHELRLAATVQQRLLPARMPDISGYRMYGRTVPAREVGGDFYTIIPLNDQRWYIAVGDVSGKGVVGAFFMAIASSMIDSHLRYAADRSQVLTAINPAFYNRMASQKQNTALAHVILDPQTGQIQVGNAGLIAPILRHCKDDKCRYLDVVGLPLGAVEQNIYEEALITLDPGDMLVLVSDGVVEAQNKQRELFGLDTLTRLIDSTHSLEAELVGAAIFDQVQQFLHDHEPADDMTVVVIERVPA